MKKPNRCLLFLVIGSELILLVTIILSGFQSVIATLATKDRMWHGAITGGCANLTYFDSFAPSTGSQAVFSPRTDFALMTAPFPNPGDSRWKWKPVFRFEPPNFSIRFPLWILTIVPPVMLIRLARRNSARG